MSTSVTCLLKERIHRGLNHSFVSTNLMSHPLQLMASFVVFLDSPSCRNLGTRILLRGEVSNTSCYGCPNYHHYFLNHASNPLVNQVVIKLKEILFIFNSNLQSKSRKFLV
jgi:hypothetical protein